MQLREELKGTLEEIARVNEIGQLITDFSQLLSLVKESGQIEEWQLRRGGRLETRFFDQVSQCSFHIQLSVSPAGLTWTQEMSQSEKLLNRENTKVQEVYRILMSGMKGQRDVVSFERERITTQEDRIQLGIKSEPEEPQSSSEEKNTLF